MATTARPQIQVHASFPRTVTLGADLNIDPTNWHWLHCLTVPLETFNTLQVSQRPYKWIRYAIGVVVGAEGDLSCSPDSSNVVDYNAGLPAESVLSMNLYYHTNDEEKRRMFPADPNTQRTSVPQSDSFVTTRRARFREDVAKRDSGVCLLAGMGQLYCDAVHLVAHHKGDSYISAYTQRRSRDPTGADIVKDIDDVRNGLFLNSLTHMVFGQLITFLKTPNFAMNTTDIDPTAQPEDQRYTAHLFSPDQCHRPALGNSMLPLGSPLQISDGAEWPPAILFDALYADAIIHNFGTQTLKDEITETWKDTHSVTVLTAEERAQKQAEERKARYEYEARRGPDNLDMLMILPYIMVPRNEVGMVFREAEEKAEVAEQRRVEEKVDTWMKQVTSE